MATLDLDPFRKIFEDYEARKQWERDRFKSTFKNSPIGPEQERRFARMATLYDGEAEKAFDALPVLIEALEQAETENADLRRELLRAGEKY